VKERETEKVVAIYYYSQHSPKSIYPVTSTELNMTPEEVLTAPFGYLWYIVLTEQITRNAFNKKGTVEHYLRQSEPAVMSQRLRGHPEREIVLIAAWNYEIRLYVNWLKKLRNTAA
jgi:hypothetical protein